MSAISNRFAVFDFRHIIGFLMLMTALVAGPAAAQSCNPSPGTFTDTAFDKLLSDCEGQIITFSAGTYRFIPSGFQPGHYIPAGTTLQGNGSTGSAATIFQIAYSGAYQSLLWAHNASNVTIAGIDFEGIDAVDGNRSYSSGCPTLYYGSAISIVSDTQTTPPVSSVENVVIKNNLFHDFNGWAWINIQAADESPGIGLQTEIAVSNNTFTSDSLLNGGCAATQGQIVYMVNIQGSLNYPTNGIVKNISIASNQFNAGYIEGAVAIWSNAARVSVQYNTINGAGNKLPAVVQPTATTEPKRYAILIYSNAYIAKEDGQPGNGLPPDTIWVIGNNIANPESCGIYAADATNLGIQSNTISGQVDIYDSTIPKAAIALNQSTTMGSYPLQDNTLSANYVGLAVVLGNTHGLVATGSNSIAVPSHSFGAKLTLGPGSSDTLNLQGITLTASPNSDASSVVGYGLPGSQAFIGVAQNGWTVSGGTNPALSWYASPASPTAYTTFSQVPTVTFGNGNVPLTANGVVQTAFWHP
jgi:hypothetical protein